MLDNKTLLVFLEVARTQSMTKAANHLHLTEPSVSRMMRSLEERLGYKLFQRRSKNLLLTKSGQLLQDRAKVIVDLVQELEHEFNHLEHQIKGKINIGLAETPAFRLIAPFLVQMHERYPRVHFSIESGNAEQVCAKLDNGQYDFGLVVASFPNANLYQVLTLPVQDQWGVILPRDHRLASRSIITPEDLKDEPLLFSRQEQQASSRPQSQFLSQFSIFGSDINAAADVTDPSAGVAGADGMAGANNAAGTDGTTGANSTAGAPDAAGMSAAEGAGAVDGGVAIGGEAENANNAAEPATMPAGTLGVGSGADTESDLSAIYTGSSLVGSTVTGEVSQRAPDSAAAQAQSAQELVEALDLSQEGVGQDENADDSSADNMLPQSSLSLDNTVQEQWLSDSPLKTWFGPYWPKLNIVTSYNLINNAALLVEAKMGLALAINGIIDLTNHPHLCFIPLSPALRTNVAIIWPRFRGFTPAARMLRDEFIQTWGDTPE